MQVFLGSKVEHPPPVNNCKTHENLAFLSLTLKQSHQPWMKPASGIRGQHQAELSQLMWNGQEHRWTSLISPAGSWIWGAIPWALRMCGVWQVTKKRLNFSYGAQEQIHLLTCKWKVMQPQCLRAKSCSFCGNRQGLMKIFCYANTIRKQEVKNS